MQISGHSVPHSFSIKSYDANGSCSHMNLALVLRDNLGMAPRWDRNGIITNGLSYSWHEWKYTFRDCATVFSHFPESKNKYVTVVVFLRQQSLDKNNSIQLHHCTMFHYVCSYQLGVQKPTYYRLAINPAYIYIYICSNIYIYLYYYI